MNHYSYSYSLACIVDWTEQNTGHNVLFYRVKVYSYLIKQYVLTATSYKIISPNVIIVMQWRDIIISHGPNKTHLKQETYLLNLTKWNFGLKCCIQNDFQWSTAGIQYSHLSKWDFLFNNIFAWQFCTPTSPFQTTFRHSVWQAGDDKNSNTDCASS